MKVLTNKGTEIQLEQLIKACAYERNEGMVGEAHHSFRNAMQSYMGQPVAAVAQYGYGHGARGCTGRGEFNAYSGSIRVGKITDIDFEVRDETFFLPTSKFMEGPAGMEGHNSVLKALEGIKSFWTEKEGKIPCHYKDIPGTPKNWKPEQGISTSNGTRMFKLRAAS